LEKLGFEETEEDFYKVLFRDAEIGEFEAWTLRFRPMPALLSLREMRTSIGSFIVAP
jgi:hypothetical protein